MRRRSTPKAGGVSAERRRKLALLSEIHTKLTPAQCVLLREAFPAVLEENEATLFKRLCRRGLSETAAEDALQEIFLGLHDSIRDNGSPRSIPRLLHAIMKNKAASYLRAKLHEALSVGLPSSRSMPPGSTPDLDRALDVAELLQRFIHRLSPDQRAVIRLVRLEELSFEEAAEKLGIPVGTVKTRLLAAEEKLKALAARFLLRRARRLS